MLPSAMKMFALISLMWMRVRRRVGWPMIDNIVVRISIRPQASL
jgi:hypothetical protein